MMKWLIPLISIIFIISGCENISNKKEFKIGTNIWPGYEALHLAKSGNYFHESGIDVIRYPSATEVLNKFRKKELDAAALTLDEVVLLHDQGYHPVIVAVLDISNGADAVIAQSEIKSINELKNKSIGVENSALGAYMLTHLLQKAKLTNKDIILVPLAVNQHEHAFKQKVVDAVVTFEPTVSKLLKMGGNIVFSSKDIPGEIVDVLVVQEELKNTKLIDDILQGWSKAVAKINQKDKNTISVMANGLQQSEEELLASLKTLSIPSLQESNILIKDGTLKESIVETGEIMHEKRLIKSKAEPENFF